jgi:hypothetical protein
VYSVGESPKRTPSVAPRTFVCSSSVRELTALRAGAAMHLDDEEGIPAAADNVERTSR